MEFHPYVFTVFRTQNRTLKSVDRFVNLRYAFLCIYWIHLKTKKPRKHLVYRVLTEFDIPKSERRRIRTFDRLLRREVLYPAELCAH